MKKITSILLAIVMAFSSVLIQMLVKANAGDAPTIVKIDDVNSTTTKINGNGGEATVIVMVKGTAKPEDIKLQAKVGNEIKKLVYSVKGNKAKKTINITIPANATDKEITYDLKFNATGSKEVVQDSPACSIVQEKGEAKKQVGISELKVKYKDLPLKESEQTITVKGANLASAKQKKLSIYKSGYNENLLRPEAITSDFSGTDELQSISFKVPESKDDVEYRAVIDFDGVNSEITFKQNKDGTTEDAQEIAPKKAFTLNEKSLIIYFHENIKEYKKDSIRNGLELKIDGKTVAITKADTVRVNENIIQIDFDKETFTKPEVNGTTSTSTSKLELIIKENTIKTLNNNPNKAYTQIVSPNAPLVTGAEFVKGYQNPSTGGQVQIKLTGYNLPDDLKIKILENNKEKTLAYSTDAKQQENFLINDLKITGSSKEKVITFTAPENKTSKLVTYSVLFSTDGGKIYSSELAATIEEKIGRAHV